MRKNNARIMAALLALGAVALLAVGCGGSSSSSSSASTPAATTTAVVAPSTIGVEASEMKFVLTSPTAAAGKVTFDVKNVGSVKHEMVVIKTDKPAGDLAVNGKVPETGAVGEVESDDLPAGASKSKTLTLEPGHYALICNLPGHYAGGMYSDLNVT